MTENRVYIYKVRKNIMMVLADFRGSLLCFSEKFWRFSFSIPTPNLSKISQIKGSGCSKENLRNGWY